MSNYAFKYPPQGTTEELADAARRFSDLVGEAFRALGRAEKVLGEHPASWAENDVGIAGWKPKFPTYGQKIADTLNEALFSLQEVSNLAAIQGYSAERQLRNEE
jgi:hypothetical protein